MDGVDIVALRPALWPELCELFGEGGDPTTCWCSFWRFTASSWASQSTADHRAWLRDAAHDESRPSPGLVAHRESRALGWVSLGERAEFSRLARSRTIPVIDGDSVWSIVCFVISRDVRGQGLADDLLSAAAHYAGRHGAATLEAYPVAVPAGTRLPASAIYTGVESQFLAAGFRRVSETTSTASGAPRVVVRRDLRDGAGDSTRAR